MERGGRCGASHTLQHAGCLCRQADPHTSCCPVKAAVFPDSSSNASSKAQQPCARTPPTALQPLTSKMRLRVRDQAGGEWREVAVPRAVRALVLLNIQVGASRAGWRATFAGLDSCLLLPARLSAPSCRAQLLCAQSYGGGRDIVGLGDSTLLEGQQFKRDPIFDDGLIEASPAGRRVFLRAGGCCCCGVGWGPGGRAVRRPIRGASHDGARCARPAGSQPSFQGPSYPCMPMHALSCALALTPAFRRAAYDPASLPEPALPLTPTPAPPALPRWWALGRAGTPPWPWRRSAAGCTRCGWRSAQRWRWSWWRAGARWGPPPRPALLCWGVACRGRSVGTRRQSVGGCGGGGNEGLSVVLSLRRSRSGCAACVCRARASGMGVACATCCGTCPPETWWASAAAEQCGLACAGLTSSDHLRLLCRSRTRRATPICKWMASPGGSPSPPRQMPCAGADPPFCNSRRAAAQRRSRPRQHDPHSSSSSRWCCGSAMRGTRRCCSMTGTRR